MHRLHYIDISGYSSARLYNQNTVGKNGDLQSLCMKISHKQ